MSSSQVAIIGAGMTGITAARSLNNAGYTVQLFEKSRGSGGRLASNRSAMGRVNLGTQAFHADQAEFLAELDHWQHAGWLKQTEQQWTSGDYLDVTVESTQAGITRIPWSRGHWYFGGARLNCPLCDEHRQRSNPLDVGANSFWHSPAAPIDLSLGRLQRPRRTAGLAGPTASAGSWRLWL